MSDINLSISSSSNVLTTTGANDEIYLSLSSDTKLVSTVLQTENTLSINTAGSVTPTSLLDLSDVNASSITDTQVLVYDAATQTFIPGSNGASSDTNIGNTDQTLTGVRDVEMDGNNLTFSQGDTVRHTISPTLGATFFRGVTIDGDNADGGKLSLKEASPNGTSIFSLSAPASLASNVEFILPSTDGSSGQFLKTDGSGNLSFATPTDTDTQLTTEQVQDIVGGMLTGNTETRISVEYQDGDGTIDFTVDDMTADTNLGNTDQTLAAARDVEMGGNSLTFSNSSSVVHTISPTTGVTFNRGINITGTASAGAQITLREDTDNGTDGVILKAPAALGSTLTLTLPSADGSDGHFLKTDGAGNLSFAASSGGLSNVVEDTTPQLGGDLDAQSNNITNLGSLNGTAASTIISGAASGATGLQNVVEDTTPQLGGSLDVNGNKIVSTSNGDIDIEPNGTGDVLLGNFKFDADQTVGAGQDNHVLTYDNSTGKISLEAAGGGGGYKMIQTFSYSDTGTTDKFFVQTAITEISGTNAARDYRSAFAVPVAGSIDDCTMMGGSAVNGNAYRLYVWIDNTSTYYSEATGGDEAGGRYTVRWTAWKNVSDDSDASDPSFSANAYLAFQLVPTGALANPGSVSLSVLTSHT